MKKSILRKPGFWVGLVIFLGFATPCIVVAYILIRDWQLPRAYEAIKQGDSIQRVVSLMGQPLKKPINNDPSTTWDGEAYADHHTDVTSRTVTTYWFSHGFASSYAIGFDAKGRAVTKYCYTSP